MATPVERMVKALRASGIKVIEHPGWRTRRMVDGPFAPKGIVFHHDASGPGRSPGVESQVFRSTRPGLEGALLSQFWVDYDGNWRVLGNGRAWHAGTGSGWGVIRANMGNVDAIGVETDHTVNEAWPAGQFSSIRKGMAAICREMGWNPAVAIVGHREYAPRRKVDPAGVDLFQFRREVAQMIKHPGTAPSPTPAPIKVPLAEKEWFQMANLTPGVHAEIAAIVDGRLSYWLPRMTSTVVTGKGNAAFTPTNIGTAINHNLSTEVAELKSLVVALTKAVSESGHVAVSPHDIASAVVTEEARRLGRA